MTRSEAIKAMVPVAGKGKQASGSQNNYENNAVEVVVYSNMKALRCSKFLNGMKLNMKTVKPQQFLHKSCRNHAR